MNKILIPTDFSDCANHASTLAIQFAKKIKAEVVFLHLMSVPIDWIHVDSERDKFYSDITKNVNHAHHLLDGLVSQAEHEKVSAKKHIQLEHSIHKMLEYAEYVGCDLIIAGSHGASGPKELFLGSFAQRIVRVSHIPTLIVKESTKVLEPKNIAFCSDFSPEYLSVYRAFENLVEKLGAAIHLVYINTPSDFVNTPTIMNRMDAFTEQSERFNESKDVYCFESFEDGLANYCSANEIDIVTMITHGNRNISRLFSGSFTESVVNHIQVPVLTYSQDL
jgi:nucleotide-binding universal stress UspA family protein